MVDVKVEMETQSESFESATVVHSRPEYGTLVLALGHRTDISLYIGSLDLPKDFVAEGDNVP